MHRHRSVDPSSVGITVRDPEESALFKIRMFHDSNNQTVFKGAYLIFLTLVLTVLVYLTAPAKLPSPDLWLSENPAIEMKSLRFNEGNNQWEPADSASQNTELSTLKIVSWNVYKKSDTSKSRLEKLIPIIQNEDPDIVCLQELTPTAIKVLKSHPYIRSTFYIAEDLYDINLHIDSAIIIMSKFPITKLRAQKLWSGYHKFALMSEFDINDKKLAVLTFQLEQGFQDQLERWAQLKIMREFVKDYDNAIFAGDFFFTDEDEYDEFELYNDAYAILRGNVGGFTYDPVENSLLKEKLKHAKAEMKQRMRRDLILMKGDDWKANDVKLLGDTPIEGEFLSTHYGLSVNYVNK